MKDQFEFLDYVNEIVKKWGSFKKDKLDLNQLGVFRNKAIEIFDKSGWK